MTRRRSFISRVIGFLFWSIVLACLVAVLSVLSGRELFDRLDEGIRARVESEFAARLPAFHVDVGSARRNVGNGIELRDVRLRLPVALGSEPAPLATIDHMLVHCSTDLADFATGEIEPTAIEVRGVKLQLELDAQGQFVLPPPVGSDGTPIPILMHDIQAFVKGPHIPETKWVDLHAELLPHFAEGAATPQWVARLWTGAGAASWKAVGRLAGDKYSLQIEAPRCELRPDLFDLAKSLDPRLGDWSLRGAAQNIRATIAGGDGIPLQYELECDVTNGHVEHLRSPVAADSVRGSVRIDADGAKVTNLHASLAGAPVHVPELHWDAGSQRLKAEAVLSGLRLDERLTRRFPQKLRQKFEEHRAKGEIAKASCSVEYELGKGFVRNSWDIDCRDFTFQFPSLPYQFHRAAGAVTIRGDRVAVSLQAPVGGRSVQIVGDFRDCNGENAKGWIEMGTDGAVPLDEEMIAALSPNAQRIVRSFRPQGALKLWGYMRRDGPGKPMQKQTVIKLVDMAVRYEKLPYPVNRISGTMTMKNDDWTFSVRGRNQKRRHRVLGRPKKEPRRSCSSPTDISWRQRRARQRTAAVPASLFTKALGIHAANGRVGSCSSGACL